MQDIQEKWMHYEEPLERHQKSKMFIGKVTELQCAEWIETLGWTIVSLDALREGADVEATKPDSGVVTTFEVKSIGVDDDDFEIMIRSLMEGPSGGASCLYVAINYLIFRIYQAAKQLESFNEPRVALVVIDDEAWWRFRRGLEEGWLDLANPAFFNCHPHPKWEALLRGQAGRYPNLEVELADMVRQLDAVWIIRRLHGYEYNLEYELHPSTPT